MKPSDAAVAWERFASTGAIPFEAIGDPRRAFECGECGGEGTVAPPVGWWAHACPACSDSDGPMPSKGRGVLPHPVSAADAAMFSTRWPDMLAAEALAREANEEFQRAAEAAGFSRLPAVERVVWRVGKRGLGKSGVYPEAKPFHYVQHGGGTMPSPALAAIWRLGFALEILLGGTAKLVCPTEGT